MCGLKEMMTSNYLTASCARHVTFPRVFPIGLWEVPILSLLLLVLMLKKGICVRICPKFSVKCEASHKNIVKVDFLMLVTFQ